VEKAQPSLFFQNFKETNNDLSDYDSEECTSLKADYSKGEIQATNKIDENEKVEELVTEPQTQE
jgi:hypothetical protein